MTSLLLPFAIAVLVVLFAGCSKDSSSPTSPGPVAEPFESGDLVQNQSFLRVFNNAGSFSYHCRHHAMSATVAVAAGGQDSAHIHISGNAFHPPIAGGLPIRPGGYVRWVNGDLAAHTVTRP